MLALILTVVGLVAFAAACSDGGEEDGTGDGGNAVEKVAYSVAVTSEDEIDFRAISAKWMSGSADAASSKLGQDGKASVQLEPGSYAVTLAGVPEGYSVSPESMNVSKTIRDAQFTITKDVQAPMSHSVTVTVTAGTGVTIPNGLTIQLYNGTEPEGTPVPLTGTSATLTVPNGDYFSAVLVGLPDYLQAEAQSITTATKSVTFTVSLKSVDYTVTVDADEAILDEITVTFSDASGAVSGATELALTGGSVTKSLLAGDYTVTIDVPEGYSADKASAQVTATDRTAAFTVEEDVEEPTTHKVTVNITNNTGVTLSGLTVQLYMETTAEGEPVAVSDGDMITVPNGDYTAKLLNLPDYIQANEQNISTTTETITFVLTLKQVTYTVSVDAPASIHDDITAVFYKDNQALEDTPVRGLADDKLTFTVTLLAGEYFVKISVPDGYAADQASADVTKENRTAQFTVHTTRHSVTVNITNDTGVELEGLTVQLYEGEIPFGTAMNISDGASITVSNGDYTARLLGLEGYDYLTVNVENISTLTDEITFVISLTTVEYTVIVNADEEIFEDVTVTFSNTEGDVGCTPVRTVTGGKLTFTVTLLAGSYTVAVNVPEGYIASPADASVDMAPAFRSVTFYVNAEYEPPANVSVTVTVAAGEGVTLPDGIGVQLYNAEGEEVYNIVPVRNNTATLIVPNDDGTYTAKLVQLPDYLHAEAQTVTASSESVAFTIERVKVNYTVSIDAPAAILATIKVTFYLGGDAVGDATDLPVTGGELTVALYAAEYTVKLSGIDAKYYHVTPESFALGKAEALRTAEFTVESIAHDLTVTIVNETGIALNNLRLQLFKGIEPFGEPVAVSDSTMNLIVPNGDYTIKLLGLADYDYLTVDEHNITTESDSVTFEVTLATIEYTVIVNAPEAVLETITVVFYKDGEEEHRQALSGSITYIQLTAGEYTVRLIVPDDYEIDGEEASVGYETRTAQFAVTQRTHGAEIVVSLPEGVDFSGFDLAVQLYDGEGNEVGDAAAVVGGKATMVVPYGNYTVKLLGLEGCDYLQFSDASISTSDAQVTIEVTLAEVEYTVSVDAPEDVRGDITVTFYKGDEEAFSSALSALGAIKLTAGEYTVKLSGFDELLYSAAPASYSVGYLSTARAAAFTVERIARYVEVTITNNSGESLTGFYLTVQLYKGSQMTGNAVPVSNGKATVLVPLDGEYRVVLSGIGGTYLTASEGTISTDDVTAEIVVTLATIEYTVTVDAPSDILGSIKVTFYKDGNAVEGATNVSLDGDTAKVYLVAGNYTVKLTLPSGYAADAEGVNVTLTKVTATFTVALSIGIDETLEDLKLTTSVTKIMLDNSVKAGVYTLTIFGEATTSTTVSLSFDGSTGAWANNPTSEAGTSAWQITFTVIDTKVIYLYLNSGSATVSITLEEEKEAEIYRIGVDTPVTVEITGKLSGSVEVMFDNVPAGVYLLEITSGSSVDGNVFVSVDSEEVGKSLNTLALTKEIEIPAGAVKLTIVVEQLNYTKKTATLKLTYVREIPEKTYLTVNGSWSTTYAIDEGNSNGKVSIKVPLLNVPGPKNYTFSFEYSLTPSYKLNGAFIDVYPENGSIVSAGDWETVVTKYKIQIPANCENIIFTIKESDFYNVALRKDAEARNVNFTFYLEETQTVVGETEDKPIVITLDNLVGTHTASGLTEAYFQLPRLNNDEVKYLITFAGNVSVAVRNGGNWTYISKSGSEIELSTATTTLIRVSGTPISFTIAEKEEGGNEGGGFIVDFDSNWGSLTKEVKFNGKVMPGATYAITITIQTSEWYSQPITFSVEGGTSFTIPAGGVSQTITIPESSTMFILSSNGGTPSCTVMIDLVYISGGSGGGNQGGGTTDPEPEHGKTQNDPIVITASDLAGPHSANLKTAYFRLEPDGKTYIITFTSATVEMYNLGDWNTVLSGAELDLSGSILIRVTANGGSSVSFTLEAKSTGGTTDPGPGGDVGGSSEGLSVDTPYVAEITNPFFSFYVWEEIALLDVPGGDYIITITFTGAQPSWLYVEIEGAEIGIEGPTRITIPAGCSQITIGMSNLYTQDDDGTPIPTTITVSITPV